MPEVPKPLTVLIASYLEPEHVATIRAVDPRVRVLYEPTLLRPPRYPADHHGHPAARSLEEEARWQALLGEADILFDFDDTHRDDLPDLAPNVRWIQATSAGIGTLVKARGYDTRMPGTVFTTASGVHAQPLAEFCLLAMLWFYKGFGRLIADQGAKRWERYASTDLEERTLGIVGVGQIGREVARLAQALRMTVLGSKRHTAGVEAASLHLDELFPADALERMLPRCEVLVIVTPHTDQTERLIGARELGWLPPGALFINIGRGVVVDEAALIEALHSGHLGGAALDVFAEEPLPTTSPLWDMPNVLVSPHSASTSDRENARLTALFCDNLRRFVAGEPLRNVLDPEAMY